MPPGFYPARGRLERWLRRNGFAAVTLPWRRVYVLDEYQHRRDVIAHEQVHLDQIERYGPACFAILYLWWLCRFGYERHPLEVEAYGKAPID
jgi:hypothetical protein